MVQSQKQEQFIKLATAKLSINEVDWLQKKIAVISNPETIRKFSVFFSLASRFVSGDQLKLEADELIEMEKVYPGFGLSTWTRQDLVRVLLMIHLDPGQNKQLLETFYETAEMHELIAFFKGLYLLENAAAFTKSVEEGIRTNMVNVFDAIAAGNPFAISYLEEWAWNQLVLKALFLDRPLFTIYHIDEGKNSNLADMLQDYIKERWAAERTVSPEIWRMVEGYLRDDVRDMLSERNFEGIEKEAINGLLGNSEMTVSGDFWNRIGKSK